jgi:hypothetical protein
LNRTNFDQTGARGILEEHPWKQIGIVDGYLTEGKGARLWSFMLC